MLAYPHSFFIHPALHPSTLSPHPPSLPSLKLKSFPKSPLPLSCASPSIYIISLRLYTIRTLGQNINPLVPAMMTIAYITAGHSSPVCDLFCLWLWLSRTDCFPIPSLSTRANWIKYLLQKNMHKYSDNFKTFGFHSKFQDFSILGIAFRRHNFGLIPSQCR